MRLLSFRSKSNYFEIAATAVFFTVGVFEDIANSKNLPTAVAWCPVNWLRQLRLPARFTQPSSFSEANCDIGRKFYSAIIAVMHGTSA